MDRRATAEVTWLQGARRRGAHLQRHRQPPRGPSRSRQPALGARRIGPEHFRAIATAPDHRRLRHASGSPGGPRCTTRRQPSTASPTTSSAAASTRTSSRPWASMPALLPDALRLRRRRRRGTPQAAAAGLWLVAGTPVAGGQVDCNAGWLQGGAIEPGDIQMNLGTAGNFGIIHRDRDFLFSASSRGLDQLPLHGGLRHTRSRCPPRPPAAARCATCATSSPRPSWQAERDARASAPTTCCSSRRRRSPPGCDGLLFLPYLMGERTPIWDANARGVIFGLSLNHTKGHLVRAALEGVAFALYHSFETLGAAGLRVNYPLVLNEGGARSALWRRIITDVFDVGTVLLERRTGAPFGDAILAGVATGVFPRLRRGAPVGHDRRAHGAGSRGARALHGAFRALQAGLRDLKDDFVTLARLRAGRTRGRVGSAWSSSRSCVRARAQGDAIRVGIVGCGQMGSGLAHTIHNVVGMRVAAIADIDPDAGIRTYAGDGPRRGRHRRHRGPGSGRGRHPRRSAAGHAGRPGHAGARRRWRPSWRSPACRTWARASPTSRSWRASP